MKWYNLEKRKRGEDGRSRGPEIVMNMTRTMSTVAPQKEVCMTKKIVGTMSS